MRIVLGLLTVVALTWGLTGCENQAPKSEVAQANPTPAKSPSAPSAPVKSSIPAAKLAQVVLEVPGMT
jgi:hypothetical protein